MAIFPSCELILDRQAFAAETGVSFTGLSIVRKGIGWRVILRGQASSGVALYTLTECGNPAEGLQQLYDALVSRHGRQLWSRDKFASTVGRKGG